MEFEFDEDQRLLQRLVRETVAKSRSLPEEQLWATYLELGWLEAPPVELAIICEELGYVADPTPFLATATWFAPLAGRLPEGSGTGVFDGAGRFVLDADRVDEVALVTRDGVIVARGDEVAVERVSVFDPTLPSPPATPARAWRLTWPRPPPGSASRWCSKTASSCSARWASPGRTSCRST